MTIKKHRKNNISLPLLFSTFTDRLMMMWVLCLNTFFFPSFQPFPYFVSVTESSAERACKHARSFYTHFLWAYKLETVWDASTTLCKGVDLPLPDYSSWKLKWMRAKRGNERFFSKHHLNRKSTVNGEKKTFLFTKIFRFCFTAFMNNVGSMKMPLLNY